MKSPPKRILIAALCLAALFLVVSPVQAGLQIDIHVWNTTMNVHTVVLDGGPGDTDGIVNSQILLPNEFKPFGPGNTKTSCFVVSGSRHWSTHGTVGDLNIITSGSSTAHNYCSDTVHAEVAISDTDFIPRSSFADATGSGTWVKAQTTSTIVLRFYNDPDNVQGANSLVAGGQLTPGIKISEFIDTPSISLDSFSHNDENIPVNDAGVYSMTLYFAFDLKPGGELTSRAQSEAKNIYIPEFPTMVLPAAMLISLLGVVFYIRKTRQH